MQRRGFLRALLGGAAVAADPERFLWEPGRKLISIAKPIATPAECGISIKQYRELKDGAWSTRLDVLYGFGTLYPDGCAVRVSSEDAIEPGAILTIPSIAVINPPTLNLHRDAFTFSWG